jgi:hypothetical protein
MFCAVLLCHVVVRVNQPVEHLDVGVVVEGGVIHNEDADDWTGRVDTRGCTYGLPVY